MQDSHNNQSDEIKKKAHEAIDKLFNEISDEDFAESLITIGKGICTEVDEHNSKVKAKVLHIKGLQATQAFEAFVKESLKDVKKFDKFNDPIMGDVTYNVVLPRIYLANRRSDGIVQKLSEILTEATCVDISIEDEDPDYEGMVYLDVSFPTVLSFE